MYNNYFFFISEILISPRIKIYNMNLYAESAESQLLKNQGLNKCMFGKLIYKYLHLGGGVSRT